MECKACGYDDDKLKEKEAFVLEHPDMFEKTAAYLKEFGTRAIPFIDAGVLVSTKEVPGVSGHPRLGDGTFHNVRQVFACPRCGTLKIEVKL